MDEYRYTVLIYTEDQIGLLVQISNIFTRRSLSIWSMYAAPSKVENVHTITIVADGPQEKMIQAKMQLEKRMEVIRVYIDKGNTIENWPSSPSATSQRDSEIEKFINDRNEQIKH